MLFKDSGIFSPKIDANRNLCYTVKVKNLDYTPQMADLIFSLYEDGKTADIELIGISETPDPDMMIKLRGDLGSLMSIYCQEQKIDLKEEAVTLRAKYGVQSRIDMSRLQLEESIKRYRAGLKYNG